MNYGKTDFDGRVSIIFLKKNTTMMRRQNVSYFIIFYYSYLNLIVASTVRIALNCLIKQFWYYSAFQLFC